jgi:hypothetical protein
VKHGLNPGSLIVSNDILLDLIVHLALEIYLGQEGLVKQKGFSLFRHHGGIILVFLYDLNGDDKCLDIILQRYGGAVEVTMHL